MGSYGGNLVIGQSGGPTAVINSSLCGAIQEALRHPQIDGIYGMRHGIQGLLQEDLIDLRRQPPSVISGLRRTPSAALGSCRYKIQPNDYERVINICRAHDIRFFLYIGGGDTMHNLREIEQLAAEVGWELCVIGIPKTIDNDLSFTDHSPGFGSAARYLAITFSEIVRDTRALCYTEKVKIVETMGRNSGWLTAAAALAGDFSPDLIYVPEKPFEQGKFLGDVEMICRERGCAVIAACEGLRFSNGQFVAANQDSINVDAFGHPELGGLGQFLVDLVTRELKLKTRLDKPGTMQRSAGQFVSSVDEEEAYQVGAAAVREAVAGNSGKMITLVRNSDRPYHCSTGLAPLEAVANSERHLPSDYINPEGNGVTSRFIEYAKPLLGAPLPPYVVLEEKRVPKKLLK